MKYYVFYNAKLMATKGSLNSAKRFIERKGYRDDADNLLVLTDADGNEYAI